jgi:AAA domain, putative AbiEii toxin, Type IV TA system
VSSNFDDHASIENLVNTFLTTLKGLPGQDPAIQADIAMTSGNIEKVAGDIKRALQQDPRVAFHKLIPRFVFHSTTLDRIPNNVSISEFVKDPDGTSKGMANLCKVAGLSTQKIQELASATDAGRRQNFEDNYRSSISGGLNEFWTQETYTIHFQIEKDRLIVSVSDKNYDRRIIPSDRSDGFQWYLSFYSALLSEVSASDPTVVLLDNPALELHADGQRDIKRFLEEKLPNSTQVLYVTHSPAMIDTYNLEQVRTVELHPNMQGTKVRKLEIKNDTIDLLEPVRSAIGASLITSLIANDFNVLVEGAADKPILEGAFARFFSDDKHKIVVNGSIAETGMLLPRFYERIGLPYVIYLDHDSGGRELKAKLEREGISAAHILIASDAVRRDEDFELEDTAGSLYCEAVRRTYPGTEIAPPENARGKCTKHYERVLKEVDGIEFRRRGLLRSSNLY